MKFESMILGVLFFACFGICVLAMGAMLTASAAPAQMAGTTTTDSSIAATQASCTEQLDAVRGTRNKAGNKG